MSQGPDERLAAVLAMLCTSDTETIRTGERLLKPLLKSPTSILLLMNQLRSNPDVGSRHHAALLLKKKMEAQFPKVGAANQTLIRENILPMLRAETAKMVCVSIAGAISTLAKTIFAANGEWPQLFTAIVELGRSEREQDRFLSFSLLDQLAEHAADNLKPHVTTLAAMYIAGCQDPSSQVSVAAMNATTTFMYAIGRSPEVMALQPVLTPLLSVLAACANRGDTTDLIDGLQIIQQCVKLEQPLINDHIEAIVPFVTTMMQQESNEPAVRAAAGQTLMDILEGRPKLVCKKQLIVPILSTLGGIIANAEAGAGQLFAFGGRLDFDGEGAGGDDGDDDDDSDYSDDEEADINQLAQCCLNSMAMHLPSKYFVEPALQLCDQGMRSPDPKMRKAGCAILGIISEGCCDSLRPVLGSIMPALLALVTDTDHMVREVTCFSLGQFAEHCQPEILQFHSSILPAMFHSLEDPKSTVQGTACYVLEMYCENLSKETLRPFLEPLLTRLGTILKNPKPMIKEMGLSAIAATAVAAEDDFLPYADGVCTYLSPLLFTTEPNLLSVRGRALECLGHVAVAIGDVHFARYFEGGMQSAMQAIAMDNTDLMEHSYVYFANASKVMKAAFGSFLPTVMPHLLGVISQTELIFENSDDEEDDDDEGAGHAAAPGQDAGDDDDDDDDSLDNVKINGIEGFVNNKKAAITAVGSIAEHCQGTMYPYVEGLLSSMLQPGVGAIYSYHASIRGECFEIMQHFLQTVRIANGITTFPAKGEVATFPPAVNEMMRCCMQVCLDAIEEDEEGEPVSQALDSISGVLEQVGGAALLAVDDKNIVLGQRLMEVLLKLLKEKTPCQLAQKAEIEEDADDDDHDHVVIDSVADLIGMLAKVLGAGFIPHFDTLMPPLMRFTKHSRVHSDRSMAIGCFAEVVEHVGPESIKYAHTMLPIIQAGLSDSMESVRRNCAFCLGVFVTSTGTAMSGNFMHMLQWLHPLCTRPASQTNADMGGADVDNALSAVARMIKVSPTHVPLQMVLPAMVAALPLRVDELEGVIVYGCFLDLLSAQNPTALEMYPALATSLGEVLCSDISTATVDLKQFIAGGLRSLASSPSHSAALSAAVGAIANPSVRAAVVNVISTGSQ